MSDSKKHEPDIETYAIGTADRLQIDYMGGVDTVHFDLKQIKEDDFIRYYVEGFGHGVYFDTSPIPEGSNEAQHWVEDIDDRTPYEIRAVIVPEYISDTFRDLDGYEVLFSTS